MDQHFNKMRKNKISGPTKRAEKIWRDAHQAFQIFAQQHPRWRESLIDEYFIETRFIPLLNDLEQDNKDVDRPVNHPEVAANLAASWYEQIGQAKDSSQTDTRQIETVMRELLALYEMVRNHQEVQDHESDHRQFTRS
ncbi:MAG: hypothetical protein GX491_18585 [Chloroflexi bacterium]|nr:hypothetical protein [Chloroflexota bacterium]